LFLCFTSAVLGYAERTAVALLSGNPFKSTPLGEVLLELSVFFVIADAFAADSAHYDSANVATLAIRAFQTGGPIFGFPAVYAPLLLRWNFDARVSSSMWR
jgi:hypothetical protein